MTAAITKNAQEQPKTIKVKVDNTKKIFQPEKIGYKGRDIIWKREKSVCCRRVWESSS